MPRKLPLDDFRAVRVVLEADDFALSPEEPDPPPEDLVDETTWSDLFTLPDTVAFFTSNDHGGELRLMSELWGECIDHFPPELDDETSYGLMTASDEFQAATFNALGGYYRVAIDCLRAALESLTITTYCQARAARKEFEEWQKGERDIAFGEACDKLIAAPCVQQLTTVLLTQCGADLFSQHQEKRQRGWVRALYSVLSEYSHSRPGFEAVHMWGGSNGPIYDKDAFKWTHRLWLQTLGTCFVLVKLVRPATSLTARLQRLFAADAVREVPALDSTVGYLWR
jgi:hypothetical protein